MWGNGGENSFIRNPPTRWSEWSASGLGRFTPIESVPRHPLTRKCGDSTEGLKAFEKKKSEIWDPNSGVSEESSLLGCYAVSMGEQKPTFQDHTTILRNLGNYSTNGTASHYVRLESLCVNVLPLPDKEPQFLLHPTDNLFTIPTELSLVPLQIRTK
jgi:hypothetical protein